MDGKNWYTNEPSLLCRVGKNLAELAVVRQPDKDGCNTSCYQHKTFTDDTKSKISVGEEKQKREKMQMRGLRLSTGLFGVGEIC